MAAEKNQQMRVRVYYEDTDFSGRVYHASYLRFFERGRTEWLRSHGFQHGQLASSGSLTFAVIELRVEFLAAAHIDDCLEIETELERCKGPRMTFRQTIRRKDAILTRGFVDVVTLKNDRVTRPPRGLIEELGLIKRRSPDQSDR